ncbi:hypothetical protein [Streptomyces sp. NPDC000994]
MLAEHGPARLQVLSATANSIVITRVLRAELGIGLVDAKAVLRRVLSGNYSGTLPEIIWQRGAAEGLPSGEDAAHVMAGGERRFFESAGGRDPAGFGAPAGEPVFVRGFLNLLRTRLV